MVLGGSADEGQVDAGQPALRRDGEVGAVGHQPLDEHGQGIAGRSAAGVAGGVGELGDGLGVAGPGLEHHGPPAAGTLPGSRMSSRTLAATIAGPMPWTSSTSLW